MRLSHAVPHSVRRLLPENDPRSTRFRDTLSASQREDTVTFLRTITGPAMSVADLHALLALEPAAPDVVTLQREADGADLDEAALNQWDGDDDVVPPAA